MTAELPTLILHLGIASVIDPNISDQEKQCLRILAKLFIEGRDNLIDPRSVLRTEGLSLDYQSYRVMMDIMTGYSVLGGHQNTIAAEGQFCTIRISPYSVKAVRELELLEKQASEPEDIVDLVKSKAKKNHFIAWSIIVFGILTIAAAFVASILTIIDKWIELAIIRPRSSRGVMAMRSVLSRCFVVCIYCIF